MSLSELFIRTLYGRQDPATPAAQPPAAPGTPGSPAPAPVPHPPHGQPAPWLSDGYQRDGEPTDTAPVAYARWAADEAHRLALLAELTHTRSPWAAARDMDWSTT